MYGCTERSVNCTLALLLAIRVCYKRVCNIFQTKVDSEKIREARK